MARHLTRRQRRWHKRPAMSGKVLREERWRRQAFGVLRFLGELRNAPHIGGDKWKAGMLRYYGPKARELLDNVPPGLETEAADFRRLLDKCKIPLAD